VSIKSVLLVTPNGRCRCPEIAADTFDLTCMRSSFPAFVLAILLASCGSDVAPFKTTAQGGRHYGGIFNWNETGTVRSIHPLGLTTIKAARVGSLVYQGLIRFDPRDLTIRPCLAERWEVDASGKVYTMHLRSDVLFHPDPLFPKGEGRPFTARDVEQCFLRLCTASPENQMFWLFQDRVLGAEAYHHATASGRLPGRLEGVQVIDDHTLRIELVAADPIFLQILAHHGCWIYPTELLAADPAHTMRAIGTGPFILRNAGDGGVLILERSPAYWGLDEHGNKLPFLDGVRVTFNPEKTEEVDAFLQGKLSMVMDPPVERLSQLSDTLEPGTGELRFHVQRVPGLSVQFYGFNDRKPPFDRLIVRRAIALAIDQRFLVDSVLQGAAVPAGHSVVPPALRPTGRALPDQSYDPRTAQRLLAEAGYPEGKGFPMVRLQVNNGGFGYIRIAEAVQGMLERNLGIGISISVLPADQHYELVDGGKAQFWRQGWVADYPDAENFLALFYGRNAVLDPGLPSTLNSTRYQNDRFDSLYQVARATSDPDERMRIMGLAEQQAMDDATVAPLYFERLIRLVQPWVMNMPVNAMDIRDLSTVWFDPALKPR